MGEVEASSLREAVLFLRQKGYFVAEIAPVGTGLRKEIRFSNPFQARVGLKDIALFARQMATMLEAGITLGMALSIMEKQTSNQKLKKIVAKIGEDIQGGSSFAEALKGHKIFSRLFVSLVKAGEEAGAVEKVLDRIASFLEKDLALRGKIRTALTYPTIVFVFSLVVTYFLLAVVVPQFASILVSLDAQLPLITRFMMALSQAAREGFPILILLGAGFGIGVKTITRWEWGRLLVDRFKFRVPLFSPLFRKSSLASLSRTLSLLLGGGVSILSALEIARESSANTLIEKALKGIAAHIEGGGSLAQGMDLHPDLFPHMVRSMVAIGEETGAKEAMLEKIADFYEREVEDAIASLSAAVEPLLIIFLGGIVGFIVVAMFMPIVAIINTLSAQ